MLGQRRFGKIQTALLVIIALVIGANLVSPAVGHVTKKLKHLYKHLDPRYVNVGEKASDSDKVDGVGLISQTVSVTLPAFSAGQQQCKSTDVTVPGVLPGDAVVATAVTPPSWFGSDQTTVTVDSVPSANTVTLFACTSADANPPFTPTATNYRFVAFR